MTLGPKAPERRRRLIVDAALDVLRERGFAGARMADIASPGRHVSPALVAYHFGTLSAVLAEALTVAEDKFYADFDHLLSGKDERAGEALDLHRPGGERRTGDRRLGALDGGLGPGAARRAGPAHPGAARPALARARCCDVIEQGHAEGSFRCPDPAAASFRLAVADGRPGSSAGTTRPGPDHRSHDQAVARGRRAGTRHRLHRLADPSARPLETRQPAISALGASVHSTMSRLPNRRASARFDPEQPFRIHSYTKEGAVMMPLDAADLQRDAREHLMLHFTDMSVYADQDIPIYVRGDGCHLFDADGRRFIDGLSGLFCTNLGHSYGAEVGEAAREQLSTLVFMPELVRRPPGRDRARHQAGRARARRPEPGLLHLRRRRRQRGRLQAGPAVARPQRRAAAAQGHLAPDRVPRHVARRAVVHRARPRAATPFAPAAVPTHFVSQHQRLPAPARRTTRTRSARRCSPNSKRRSCSRAPEHDRDDDRRAGAELRRLLHAPARLLGRRPRDLRPVRHPARLRRGDHRLRPARRVVRRGQVRLPARHDHVRQGRHRRPRARSAA